MYFIFENAAVNSNQHTLYANLNLPLLRNGMPWSSADVVRWTTVCLYAHIPIRDGIHAAGSVRWRDHPEGGRRRWPGCSVSRRLGAPPRKGGGGGRFSPRSFMPKIRKLSFFPGKRAILPPPLARPPLRPPALTHRLKPFFVNHHTYHMYDT